MSRPGARNTVAGLALAAAGVLYRRVAGIRSTPAPVAPAAPGPAPAAPPAPEPEAVDSAEVERARSELAEELARRARNES